MLLLISFILCECSILGIFNFILKIPSYSDGDLNLLCAYMGTTERMIIKDLAQEILPHFHVVQLHLTLCDRMDCGTPGLPQFSSVSQSCSTLQPHGLLHARLPCPPPAPETCPNSCPSSRWCHPTISSSVIPFSSCLQSFPASGSFPMSWLMYHMLNKIMWVSFSPNGNHFETFHILKGKVNLFRFILLP